MDIRTRQRASNITSSGTTSMVVSKPSGTVEGDLMVFFFGGDSVGRPDMTMPSGWIATYSQLDPDLGGGAWQFSGYKVAGASEPSSYTFGVSSAGTGSLSLAVISFYDFDGVGTWNLLDSGFNENGGGGSATSEPVTGNGLYVTSFLNDSPIAKTSDNSVVGLVISDDSNSLALCVFGGQYNCVAQTTNTVWASSDDVYSNSMVFENVTGGGGGGPFGVKLGSTAINKTYLGSTEIKKIYLGNTVIHQI